MGSRVLIVLVSLALIGQTQTSNASAPRMKLRIDPAEITNGVPQRITFVFFNLGHYEVRIPPISPCVSLYFGRIALMLKFTPLRPQSGGVGGGCGGGLGHVPPIVEQAKNWKAVPPHGSYKISFKRSELFVTEERPGVYEFWGEYYPPQLTTENVLALQNANIRYPQESLISQRLRFTRPE